MYTITTPVCTPDTTDHFVRRDFEWRDVAHQYVPTDSNPTWIKEYYNVQRRNSTSSRKFELPFMQDYLNDKCQFTWSLSDLHECERTWGDQGSPDILIHIATGLNRLSAISIDHIMGHSVGNDSLPLDPFRIGVNANRAHARLVAGAYTKIVDIDMKEPLDSEFSLWMLLDDVHQLPKLARSLIAAQRVRKLRSSNPWADVAGGQLAIQYGFLPTMADIRDFVNILVRWASNIEKANRISETIYTHIEPVKELSSIDVTVPYWYFNVPSVGLAYHVRILQSCMLHQTTKFYFVMPELADLFSKVKFFVDQFGLLDPTALWDKVPWSFVVDWVFNVSQWIHRNMKPRLIPATLVICDWCESIHSHSAITADIPYRSIAAFNNNVLVDASLPIKGESYSIGRRRQFGRPLQVRNLKKLTSNDSVINLNRSFQGAALIVSRNRVKHVLTNGNYQKRTKHRST
jgi:hypothetical protein